MTRVPRTCGAAARARRPSTKAVPADLSEFSEGKLFAWSADPAERVMRSWSGAEGKLFDRVGVEAASAAVLAAVAAMTALMADRGNCADRYPGGAIAELCF